MGRKKVVCVYVIFRLPPLKIMVDIVDTTSETTAELRLTDASKKIFVVWIGTDMRVLFLALKLDQNNFSGVPIRELSAYKYTMHDIDLRFLPNNPPQLQ